MSENPKDNSTAPLEVHNEAQRHDGSSGQGNSVPVDQLNNAQQRQGKPRRRGKKKQRNGPNVSNNTVLPDKAESSSGQENAQSLPANQDGNAQNPQGKRQRNRKKKKPTETSQQPTDQANSNGAQQSQIQGKRSKETPVKSQSGSNVPIEHPEVANLPALNKAQQSQNRGKRSKKKPVAKPQSESNTVIEHSELPKHVPVASCQDENFGPMEPCILCCQLSNVFGVGQCLHPACMECVIRMRCFGESIKCHFCREDIEKMHFVRMPPSWDDYKLPDSQTKHPDCQKFKICFEDQRTIEVYAECIALTCQICLEEGITSRFTTFQFLKLHMGRKHNFFYCHICLDHLNVLPKSRQLFSDKDLTLHINGKLNVVEGIRGHPKCKFCQGRFFDDEELYKHCRKEHFYCSICSNVTGTNMFFKTAQQLHSHYQYAHYPCMEEDCVVAGIVFSNEVELSLHNIDAHATAERGIKVNFQFSSDHSRYDAPSARVSRHFDGTVVAPLPQPLPKKPVQDQNEFPPLLMGNAQKKGSKPGKLEVGFQIGRQKRFVEPPSRVVNRNLFPNSNNNVKSGPAYFTMTRAQSRPDELPPKGAGSKKKEPAVKSLGTNKPSTNPNSKEWLQSQLMFNYSKKS